MKITLGEIRRTVHDVLVEAGARPPKPASHVGDDFLLSDPDGTQYGGSRNAVRRALVRGTQLDSAERDAVMSTGHATAAVIGRLKRDGVIKRLSPSVKTTPQRAGERKRPDRRQTGKQLESAYHKAVAEFAKNWENPEPGIDPESSASDAAQGFFYEYENEWPEWARALGMTRQNMKEAITDYVYDAMTKGQKAGRATEGRVRRLRESVSRHCAFWKASNGKWYLDLARDEHGEHEDSDTYGPFSSEQSADDYLRRNFSNPGGASIDDSGSEPPPTRSPNGRPVQPPRSSRW